MSRQGGFEKMADIGPWAVMVVEVTEEYSYTDNMRSWTSTEEPVETLRGLCSGRKPKPRLTTHSMWGGGGGCGLAKEPQLDMEARRHDLIQGTLASTPER